MISLFFSFRIRKVSRLREDRSYREIERGIHKQIINDDTGGKVYEMINRHFFCLIKQQVGARPRETGLGTRRGFSVCSSHATCGVHVEPSHGPSMSSGGGRNRSNRLVTRRGAGTRAPRCSGGSRLRRRLGWRFPAAGKVGGRAARGAGTARGTSCGGEDADVRGMTTAALIPDSIPALPVTPLLSDRWADEPFTHYTAGFHWRYDARGPPALS